MCGSACFGKGNGSVFYRDVNCSDQHSEFSQCEKNMVGGSGRCGNHSRDAGVICGKLLIQEMLEASNNHPSGQVM